MESKRKYKVKLPEENTVYGLIFPSGVYPFVFVAVNDKGRVLMMNVTTKKIRDFTPGFLSKLCSKQCLYKKPYDSKSTAKFTCRENNDVVKPEENVKPLSYEERIIKELRELSPQMTYKVMGAIKRHPLELAKDLERLYNDSEHAFTQEFVNRVCGEMITACNVYRGLSL